MNPGPFNGFLKKLNIVQSKFSVSKCPIRIALVTARAAPAHKRVINTLRKQNIRIDETFFLGGLPKGKFLKGFSADIFSMILQKIAWKQLAMYPLVMYHTG